MSPQSEYASTQTEPHHFCKMWGPGEESNKEPKPPCCSKPPLCSNQTLQNCSGGGGGGVLPYLNSIAKPQHSHRTETVNRDFQCRFIIPLKKSPDRFFPQYCNTPPPSPHSFSNPTHSTTYPLVQNQNTHRDQSWFSGEGGLRGL